MLCESSVGTVSANKAAAMHSEDVEAASTCAPLRGYTMHVRHTSQQGGGSSDCTVAAKKKDTKHRHNDMCTLSNPTGHGSANMLHCQARPIVRAIVLSQLYVSPCGVSPCGVV